MLLIYTDNVYAGASGPDRLVLSILDRGATVTYVERGPGGKFWLMQDPAKTMSLDAFSAWAVRGLGASVSHTLEFAPRPTVFQQALQWLRISR